MRDELPVVAGGLLVAAALVVRRRRRVARPPRLVRYAALAICALTPAPSRAAEPSAATAPALAAATVEAWLAQVPIALENRRHETPWQRFKRATPAERAALDFPLLAPGASLPVRLAALGDLERRGLYDAWNVAWLWREPPPAAAADLAAFAARLVHHGRTAEALAAAKASLPVALRPWMSKAAPPPSVRMHGVRAGDVLARFPAAWAAARPRWTQPGPLTLTVAAGELGLWRDGRRATVTAGASFALAPLDVLEARAEVRLRHDEVGALVLPAGSATTAWTLPARLSPEAAAQVDALAAQVAARVPGAVDRAERLLPLAHAALRGTDAPDARLLVELFER